MNFKLFLLFYAIAAFTTSKVVAQSDFFTPDNGNGRSSLPAEMKTKLSKIERDSSTKYMAYFKVGKISKLEKKGKLKFSLPNVNGQLTAVVRKVEAFSDNNYFWEGVIEGGFGTITIRCENGLTYGFIHYLNESTETNEMYSLYGLTNDLSVMTQNSRKGKCGMESNTPRISDNRNTATVESRTVVPCSTPSGIRVLILSTAKARNAVSNINQSAQIAVDQFNTAVANTGIYNGITRLILADVVNVESLIPNLSSTGVFIDDVRAVKNNTNVKNARTAANADIVVLFTDENYEDGDHLGEALDIDARDADAYAGVEVETINGSEFIFTHEVGHLFGGMHENDNSPTNSAGSTLVAYAHGNAFKRRRFTNELLYGTACLQLGASRSRINQFADPDVTYAGAVTGTVDKHDEARRIVETSPRIANYRPEKLTMHISGSNVIYGYGSYTYDAVTSCGTAPYSWYWEGSTDGFNYSPIPSVNDMATYHYYQGYQQWQWLRVTVYDNQGLSTTRFLNIVYYDDTRLRITGNDNSPYSAITTRSNAEKGGNSILNINIYPNPAQNTLTTEFEINNNEPVVFRLLDVQGHEIMNEIDESLSKGKRLKKLDISKVPTGLYILKITSGESVLIEKVTIQK